jgi:hypothetical protein
MSTKSDWNAVHERLLADGRARLGEPPTEEQLLAYARGELSAVDEARVRELLVHYPELARTLRNPSSADVKPGDADYLSDAELAADFAALQKRLRGPAETKESARVLPFWPTMAAAAALLIVFSGLLIRAHRDPESVRQPATPSIAIDETFLLPGGQRGLAAEGPTVSNAADVLLVAPLMTPKEYADYRLDIVDARDSRVVWTSTGLRRRADSSFQILVPRGFLKPGKYRLVVYGLEGKAREEVGTYAVVVSGQ